MTLHEFPDVIQGTDEWHAQRRGIITASVVGQLITPAAIKVADNTESRAVTALLASERITGWTEATYMSDDMLRGTEDEPRAVEVYEQHWAPVTTTGFLVRDDWGYRIGYSPDGLVGTEGLIEVKSRAPKKHLQTILADEVPRENIAQIQCGLLVSGRPWCDYLSYCGGMPLWRKRVEPDPKWFEAIIAAAESVERAIERMTDTYRTAVAGLPETERVIEMEMTF